MAATDQIARPTGLPSGTGDVAPTGRLAKPVIWYLVVVMLPVWLHLGPLYVNFVRLLLLGLMIPLISRLFSGRCGRIIATDYLFFGYVIWNAVSLAMNNPDKVVQNVGSTGAEFLGGYLLARVYIRTPADFIALVRVFTLIILATLPFALLEARTNRPILIDLIAKLPMINSEAVIDYPKRMGLFRTQVVFAHPILYGLFCSLGFSFCLIALRDTWSFGRRLTATAGITLCTFLSISSGALLAVILQVFLISWAFIFRGTRARWWLLLGMAVLGYVLIDLASNRTPIKVFMTYATFSAQTAYVRAI